MPVSLNMVTVASIDADTIIMRIFFMYLCIIGSISDGTNGISTTKNALS
jgi:hypothetical protein